MDESSAMIALVSILLRGTVLIIAAIGGILSIYWGWRLYREGLSSAVSGEMSKDDWLVKLRSAGPGVFFAFFGMALLIYLVTQQAEVMESAGEERPVVPSAAVDAGSDGPTPLLFMASVKAANAPARRGPCLVRRIVRIRMSDGGLLTADRIGEDLKEAQRLLGLLDREALTPADQAALISAIQTMSAIDRSLVRRK